MMSITWTRRMLSALTALLLALTVLPPAGWADEDEKPDLMIEVVGLKPGSRREVVLRVTNVSVWWSDRTVATVETVSPAPRQSRTFQIPDMNTREEAPLPHVYEFVYTLAGDCTGHVVKASLSAGSNYEGVKETALANNTAQKDVCPGPGSSSPSSPSSPGSASSSSSSGSSMPPLPPGVTAPGAKPEKVTPGTTGPARTDVDYLDEPVVRSEAPAPMQAFMVPSEQRTPGTHTVTLPLSVTMRRGAHATFHGGFASAECFTVSRWNLEPKFVVGWGEYEWFGSPCAKDLYQVAVSFDRGVLDQIPAGDLNIDRVILTYDEVEMFGLFCNGVVPGLGLEDPDVKSVCWRSGDGEPEARPNGCVVVRTPSAEWRNSQLGRGLVPFVTDPRGPEIKQVSPREWDVSTAYRWQNVPTSRPIFPPGGSPLTPGFGFLLTGGADFNALEGEDSTSCVSWVTNIRLQVTYTVFPDGPGPIVR